jgi:hypothetical protein
MRRRGQIVNDSAASGQLHQLQGQKLPRPQAVLISQDLHEDVSEELSATFIRVTRIGKLGTTLLVTSNRCTDYCQSDEGGTKFLRNIGSYKSHAA